MNPRGLIVYFYDLADARHLFIRSDGSSRTGAEQSVSKHARGVLPSIAGRQLFDEMCLS